MKSGEEAVYLLIDRMNEIGVDYMIVGSFSSNAYGLARATKDADFVIQTTEDKRRALMQSLPSDFVVDDQVTFETVTGHLRQILKLPKIPYMIFLRLPRRPEPYPRSRPRASRQTRPHA